MKNVLDPLFDLDPDLGGSAAANQLLRPLTKSLRFVKMRSTGVRVQGVRLLLKFAKKLEGIR